MVNTPEAPRSLGDLVVFDYEDIAPLTVEVSEDISVNWYEEDGNLLAENKNTYFPAGEGTFYAEAVDEMLYVNQEGVQQ